MSKKKSSKQKFYAIKDGKGVKDKIVRSWDECKELVLGYPAIYKSFLTEEEANNYLGSIKSEKVEEVRENHIKAMEYKKKKKATTRSLSFRIDKDIYDQFIAKVEDTGIDKDKILLEMIKEWLY